MWACPPARQDVPHPSLIPRERGTPPILVPISSPRPPPTKCHQCPLGGSPGSAESLSASSAPLTPRPPHRGLGLPRSRCPEGQGAGGLRGRRMQLVARRPRQDFLGPPRPFVGGESSKLQAYGGGQGKVISIRGGSLRSQANTDKLCNTSARGPESFILL